MEDITLALATGVDIPIPECQLTIHQPTVREIGQLGEHEFLDGLRFLCISKPLDTTDLANVNNFQIFMTIMTDKQQRDKRDIIMDTLMLLFPEYVVNVTPRSLLFNLNQEISIIDENNFSSLQEVLRQIGCLAGKNSDAFNPANAAAAEIARKLERGRQRVAAQKQGDAQSSSVFSQYLSVLSVGLHIPLLELTKLTIFQLYDLMERYTLWVEWDLDIRTRLAGGSPDNHPDNWMKIIH